MPRECNAELCPYWDGDTCPCATFGIDPPEPGTDPATLPSATYASDSAPLAIRPGKGSGS